jgi:hypothetical protein
MLSRTLRFALGFLLALAFMIVPRDSTPVADATTGGQVWLTGHDPDQHCQLTNQSCNYLAVAVAYVRNGSTLPVLVLDSSGSDMLLGQSFWLQTSLVKTDGTLSDGSTGPGFTLANMSPSAGQATAATSISIPSGTKTGVVKRPTDANFQGSSGSTNWPFLDSNNHPIYSAILVASRAGTAFSTAMATRATDFRNYLNHGGGILALAADTNSSYYSFLPISASAVAVQTPFTFTSGANANSGAPMGTAGSYSVTTGDGHTLHLIEDTDNDCCGTHNSFASNAGLHAFEVDSHATPLAETLAGQQVLVGSSGFFLLASGGPASGTPGTSVSVSGSGFQNGASLSMTLDGAGDGSFSTSLGSCSANGSGVPTGCTFTIPSNLPGGTYTIQIADSAHSDFAQTTITINPTASLSPTSQASGSSVSVSGSAFQANETLAVSMESSPGSGTFSTSLGNCSATSNGQLSGCSFNVPTNLPGGTYAVRVSDANTGTTINTTITITPTAGVTGSPQPGRSSTVTGSGFPAGASLTVKLETAPGSGTYTNIAACTADSTGTLPASCALAVPANASKGTYHVQVTDGSGHTATITVTIGTPPLAVVGKAGTSFTLKGGNFDKSTVPSVVFTPVNGGSATTVNTACASGQKIGCIQKTSTSSINVKAPSGPTGLQQVTVTGVDVLTFSLYFDYGPAIQSISKASGDTGTPIIIKGGNFGTSKTSVPTVTMGSSTINAKCGKTLKVGCITAASDKSISFKAPTGTSGSGAITVTTVGGSVADDLTRLGAAFTYDGAITNVKPAVGAGGSTVQIQGVDFGKNKQNVTVRFGSTTLASSCSSGATGCIKTHSDTSITVIAPTGLTGSQDITVTNDEGNTADDRTITGASFDYNPAITAISPQAGPAAKTTIKLSGANFTKSLPTVTIGSSTISAKCGKALKTGCFTSNNDKSVSIKPPTTLTGMQTISMTVGGVTADNLTGGDLVFDFGAAITTEK